MSDMLSTSSRKLLSGLPEDWRWTKFGFGFFESNERNGDNPPGPLLSISEYRGVELNTRTDGQQPSADVSNYRVVRPNQLAANMMWLNHGGIGVASITGYISPAYKAFWISKKLEPRYVHHLLRSQIYIEYFGAMGTGVRPNSQMVTKVVLDATPIPLPPLAIQRRIADYLDHETGEIDAMIDKLDGLARVLEGRFIEVVRSEAGLTGESHQLSHQTRPLRWAASLVTGTTPSGSKENNFAETGEVGWVTPEDLKLPVEPTRYLTDDGIKQLKLVPTGSTLICGIGATLGKLGYATEPMTTNQQITAAIPFENIVSKYLYYALTAEKPQIIAASVATTLPIINNVRLGEVSIKIPPLTEQRRIADHLDEVTAKIDTMLAKVAELKDLLTERRAALITDVVTGRKDVA